MPDSNPIINFNVEGSDLETFDSLLKHYQGDFIYAIKESQAIKEIPGAVAVNEELSLTSPIEIYPTKPPTKVGSFTVYIKYNLIALESMPAVLMQRFFTFFDSITTNKKLSNRIKQEVEEARLLRNFLGAHYSLFGGASDNYLQVSNTFNLPEFNNESNAIKIKFIRTMTRLGLIERIGREYRINALKVRDFINQGFVNLPLKIVAKTIPDSTKADHDITLYTNMQNAGVNTPVVFKPIHKTSEYSTGFTMYQDISFLDRIPNLFKRPKGGEPELLRLVFAEIAKMHKEGILHNDLRALNIGFAQDETGKPVILIDPTRGKIIKFPGIRETNSTFIAAIEIDLSIFLGMPGLMGLVKNKIGDLTRDDISYIRECIFDTYIPEVADGQSEITTKLTFSSSIFAFTEYIDQ